MFALRCIKPNCKPIYTIPSRNFAPRHHPQNDGTFKGENPKWIGYEAHHHTKGLLPRLKIKEVRLGTLPITTKEDSWSRRQANMGRNDFVRILGNEEIQQYDLLTHIPDWLRGYRATKEYSVLMRKRKEFDYWRYTKPLKWLHLEQRIKYLYRRINNKFKPPDIELLSKSRHSL